MGSLKQSGRKMRPTGKSDGKTFAILGLIVLIILGFILFKTVSGGKDNGRSALEDLKIAKSEVSETAKFYPYKAGETNMEVLAVKASDGSIRTALNTCQVCFASGRGYYIQEGNELVCQNCGNRFKLDQVEKIKGGCNPVPVGGENKIDDGTNIVISRDFLEQSKGLFSNWKRR